jgi:hypothetical protein
MIIPSLRCQSGRDILELSGSLPWWSWQCNRNLASDRLPSGADDARFEAWVDELVAVDTGSIDGTAELARGCGAWVLQFAGCDDFPGARNASVSTARGQWNFGQ